MSVQVKVQIVEAEAAKRRGGSFVLSAYASLNFYAAFYQQNLYVGLGMSKVIGQSCTSACVCRFSDWSLGGNNMIGTRQNQ